MMKINTLTKIAASAVLSALLIFDNLFAGALYVSAADAPESTFTEIHINTQDDLKELADNCHIESWSYDKYVILDDDIYLTGDDFTGIPIFSGVFDGQGHTVYGFNYEGTGYVRGLFRYIGKTGAVQNLSADSDITASGDGYVTGMIAGVNEGIIKNCRACGYIKGDTATGGIAGINGTTGLICGCNNLAEVTGFYYTGGICGRNYGTVKTSVNYGCVDSSSDWVTENDERQVDIISEITGDVSLVSYQTGVDIGGISGYSKGIVTGCRNEGIVGYDRVGYNVGGICGRQSGVIFGCSNYGPVSGKKDVGGIVGQQEPYIEIDKTKSVSDSIARINALANKAAADAESATPDIQAAIAQLQAASGKAMDDAQSMTGNASDYKLDQKDWAGMVEQEAQNAGRAAADSVRDGYKDLFDELSGESIPDYDELKSLIESYDDPSQALEALDEKAEEARRRAEEEEEAARQQALDEKEKVEQEINDTVNGEIGRWNSALDTLDKNSELLAGDMQEVRRAGDAFISVANAYSNELSADLAAVNDSINDTYDLIEDLINGTQEQGVKYLFADVSESDKPDIINGRCISSTSYGTVSGDINIGGIAGNLAVDDENLENNALLSFDLKAGEGYAISNIISDCENDGVVILRSNCAGGIAGNMEHGCVIEGRGYGAVSSGEGQYVGGIAGNCGVSIISSYSLCTLSGNGPVGGIAGYARSLKNCVSMPIFGETNGKCGGVAGQILRESGTESIDNSEFYDNYYVANDFYGIDDISYENIASEIDYDTVLGFEGLPDAFENLKVIFVADGKIISEVRASYGDKVADLALPNIPEKEGSYGVWPDLNGVRVNGNLMIEAGYISHVAVLRTPDEYPESGRPLALVQGRFKTTDSLTASVTEAPFEPDDGSAYTDVTIYSVGFDGDGDANAFSSLLRLYSPYSDYKVWVREGGKWSQAEFTAEGSYAQLAMNTPMAMYAITCNPDERLKHAGYAAIAIFLIIGAVALIVRAVRSVKKTPKAVKTSEK